MRGIGELSSRASNIDELNHRVKNTLATVQAIAMQAHRHADDPAALVEAMEARINALAGAHDLLTERSWQGAGLADVVRRTLEPFEGSGAGNRIFVEGPAIQLSPNAAVTLSMVFHELATNAAKYGALSDPGGRVELLWRVEQAGETADTLSIRWSEHSGPHVTPPSSRGFGSKLLERSLARELEGIVTLAFKPAGVTCDMRLKISEKVRRES